MKPITFETNILNWEFWSRKKPSLCLTKYKSKSQLCHLRTQKLKHTETLRLVTSITQHTCTNIHSYTVSKSRSLWHTLTHKACYSPPFQVPIPNLDIWLGRDSCPNIPKHVHKHYFLACKPRLQFRGNARTPISMKPHPTLHPIWCECQVMTWLTTYQIWLL